MLTAGRGLQEWNSFLRTIPAIFLWLFVLEEIAVINIPQKHAVGLYNIKNE
jgi:hypothetical protein